MSLARARELAADARTRLSSGVDPLEARRADRAANQTVPSFGEWADAYVETHRKGKTQSDRPQGFWTLRPFERF